jgi:multiple sugar transport system substrate-binding protein
MAAGPVPSADVALQGLLESWAGLHRGWKATPELVQPAQLAARVAEAIRSGAGPDLVEVGNNAPWLSAGTFLDISDVAGRVERRNGAFDAVSTAACRVSGHWRALPFAVVANAWTYRRDAWAKAGRPGFVDSLDDLLKQAPRVKKQAGLALATGSLPLWYTALWGFGGQELDAKGKVVLNSKATAAALQWAIQVSREAMAAPGDSPPATAGACGGASLYLAAAGDQKTAAATETHGQLSGPRARATLAYPRSLAATRWSKQPDAARDLLDFLLDRDTYGQWLAAAGGAAAYPGAALDNHPVWSVDPKLAPFNQAGRIARWPGWPYAQRADWAAIADVTGNMFATAVASGEVQAPMDGAAKALGRVLSP